MALPVTRRGNTVYIPDGPVLNEFFWDEGKFTCIQGPIGSGTSTCGIHKIWRMACKQEPDYDGVRRSRWIVHGRTYSNLRETVLKTWDMWFPEIEWGQRIKAEPGYHRLIDIKTGGPRPHPSGDKTKVDCEVIFLALPDEDVARTVLPSWEITGFFSNEMQNTEKGVITILLSRCGRYPPKMNGPGPSWFGGFGDMNAPYEGHWVPYMRGDIPLPPEMTEDEKAQYKRPENWKFYVQPPGLIEELVNGKPTYKPNTKAENQKWLAEPYLEKIQGWPKRDIDMLVLNKIGMAQHGKPVYPLYSDDDHASTEPLEPVEGVPILVGLDFGRDPAAVFGQNVNGQWRVYSELIGDNESATIFAPRVKFHLNQKYPGFDAEFWGDPRGGDGQQATETTAFDVFDKLGMIVYPATSDNSPELRRSSMESALSRRNGFIVGKPALTLRRGLSGGYHFAKIKGREGMYSPRPVKNAYSHVVEACENMIVGGGEGFTVVSSPIRQKAESKPIIRKRPRLSRARR
jgi:hypothetical protein